MSGNLDIVTWLENWYVQQCVDRWEHAYGLDIETLDDLGWTISIDLKDTKFAGRVSKSFLKKLNEQDWHSCKIDSDKFSGKCGPINLSEMLCVFREWVIQES